MIKIHATGSTGNFYSLETSTGTLLLECGINIKKIKEALNFDLSKVVGCLLTHEHKDHSKSAKDIIKCGIDVYMSKGTREVLDISSHRLHELEYDGEFPKYKAFNIGNFIILPFQAQHDVNEMVGFLIYHPMLGKILFITDSYYVRNKFTGISHILIECNYDESVLPNLPAWRHRTIKSHMSLETLKETLNCWDLTGTKDITLIHISHDNGNPERYLKEIEELTGIKTHIGEAGLSI